MRKNKVADQPAHSRSLISAFVIRSVERIIATVATGKLSGSQLVSEAEQIGLRMTWSEDQKDSFSRDETQLLNDLLSEFPYFRWSGSEKMHSQTALMYERIQSSNVKPRKLIASQTIPKKLLQA